MIRPSLVSVLAAVVVATPGPGVLRPGETLHAGVPEPLDPDHPFAIEVATDAAGPLTLEARSLEFDTYLKVFRVAPDGASIPVGETDEGGAGTDARLLVDAATGARYRVEVSPAIAADDGVSCGRSFDLSVTAERSELLIADTPSEAHRTYWDAVDRGSAANPEPRCRLRALLGRAHFFHTKMDLAAARGAAEEALAYSWKHLRDDPLAEAAASRLLGAILLDAASYAQARSLLDHAVSLREERLGPDHPLVARAIRDLATLLEQMASYHDARSMFEQALAIMERVAGPDHVLTAEALDGLAGCPDAMSEPGAARRLYVRAQAIYEKRLGPDHPRTVLALPQTEVRSVTEEAYGSWVAVPPGVFERAVAIYEKSFGPDHPRASPSPSPPSGRSSSSWARRKRAGGTSSARSRSGRRPSGRSILSWPRF